MNLAVKSAVITIPDQKELTFVAIRLGASAIEDLANENLDDPETYTSSQPPTEGAHKFTVEINGRRERAHLAALTINCDKSRSGTAEATVFSSPTYADHYIFTVKQVRGEWTAVVDRVIPISND